MNICDHVENVTLKIGQGLLEALTHSMDYLTCLVKDPILEDVEHELQEAFCYKLGAKKYEESYNILLKQADKIMNPENLPFFEQETNIDGILVQRSYQKKISFRIEKVLIFWNNDIYKKKGEEKEVAREKFSQAFLRLDEISKKYSFLKPVYERTKKIIRN